MAATVQIREKNGAGQTATDKTNGTVRFKTADEAAVNTADPMLVPATGTNYSFEKWLRFYVSGGSYTNITNIEVYTDGSSGMGTGVGVFAKTAAAYATPAEATSTSGYTSLFTYTSGSPLTVGAGPFTSTGDKGDYVVMVMTVADTASSGVTSAETVTWVWDET
jgi:hypothetical protein